MAYRAEIEIGVKGARKIQELSAQINLSSRAADSLAKSLSERGVVGQALNNYDRLLAKAAKTLGNVIANTEGETKAVKEYVTALEQANGFRNRQNQLIQEEITRRNGATNALKAYNAELAATTQRGAATTMAGSYLRGQPKFGPQPAPGFDPVAGAARARASSLALESIKGGRAAQKRLAEQKQIFDAEVEFAKTLGSIKENLTNKIQKRALSGALDNVLEEYKVRETKSSELFKGMMKDNDELLRQFDKRLAGRGVRQKQRNQLREDLALGAGFPLLTGAGPGGVAGGVLGAVVGKGKGGFGLQILFSALGSLLDQVVVKAGQLGDALLTATQNMQGLRDVGVEVTAQAELQVRAALAAGNAIEAQQIAADQVARQTGDVSSELSRLASGSLSELQKAWNGVVNAVSTTVGVLAAPFINALAGALRLVQGIFFAFNATVGAVSTLARLIPGVAATTDTLANQALVTSEAYQRRQVDLALEAQTLEKNVKLQARSNSLQAASVNLSAQQKQLVDFQAKRLEIIASTQKKIADKRIELGAGRTPQEQKAQQRIIQGIEAQGQEELRKLFLTTEKVLLDTRRANNRSIRKFNESTEKERESIALSVERRIQDEKLRAQRALQDAQLRGRQAALAVEERLLVFTQRRRDLALSVSSIYRNIEAGLSADPQASLEAQLTNAADAYKNAILKAQEDRALSEQQIALELETTTVKLERLKKDNALAIARTNLDTARRVAAIQQKIVEKKFEVERFSLDVAQFVSQQEIKTNISKIKAQNAQLELQKQFSFGFQTTDIQNTIEVNKAAIRSLMMDLAKLDVATQNVLKNIPELLTVQELGGAAPTIPDVFSAVTAEIKQIETEISLLKTKALVAAQATAEEAAATELRTKNLSLIEQQVKSLTGAGEQLQQNRDLQEIIEQQISNGINPALAQQMANYEIMGTNLVNTIDAVIESLRALGSDDFIEDIQRLQELRGSVSNRVASLQAEAAAQFKGPIQQFVEQATQDLNNLEATAVQVSQGIGDAIGSSLANGISRLIEGSATVKEVFADMLKSIGQVLVQEGTKMIATYIAIGIAKAFAGLTGGGGANLEASTNSLYGNMNPFAGFQLAPFRATGGPVNANRPYIVGEQGPELFTPNQAGRISSTSDTRSLLGRSPVGQGAPAMNFTFETTNIGGKEFVDREQLEAAMAVTRREAANDGAKRGMGMTLDKMQHSPATRRRVGIS